MKTLTITFLIYFALVLQVGWGERLAVGGIEPAFLPLMLAVVVFAYQGWQSILWAGVIGLLSDCIAAESLGIDMLSASLIAYIGDRMLSGRKRDPAAPSVNAGAFVLATFLIVQAMLLFSTGARMLQTGLTAHAGEWLSVTAATSAYTAAIAFAVLLASRAIGRFLPQTHRMHA